jgi:hypothetical protein
MFGFVREDGHTHQGVDVDAPIGAAVWSIGPGIVEAVNRVPGTAPFRGYGRAVVVRHADGLRSMYAHLSRVSVDAGQQVVEGQQVGEVGDACDKPGNPNARCKAPHLHFELATGPYRLDRLPTRINPLGAPMPPTPEQVAARDSIERWDALDGLIGELFEAIPEARRTDDHRAMLAQWKEAYAFAPRMGAGLRASAISDWISKYNTAREQLIAHGLAAPPKVNDVGVIPDVVRAVETTVDEVKSGFGFGVALLALLLLWQRDTVQKVAQS